MYTEYGCVGIALPSPGSALEGQAGCLNEAGVHFTCTDDDTTGSGSTGSEASLTALTMSLRAPSTQCAAYTEYATYDLSMEYCLQYSIAGVNGFMFGGCSGAGMGGCSAPSGKTCNDIMKFVISNPGQDPITGLGLSLPSRK